MSKKPSSTPSKRASAKKAAPRAPATPKAKKPTSKPAEPAAEVRYMRGPGKGRGCVIEVATEADHADLAEASE